MQYNPKSTGPQEKADLLPVSTHALTDKGNCTCKLHKIFIHMNISHTSSHTINLPCMMQCMPAFSTLGYVPPQHNHTTPGVQPPSLACHAFDWIHARCARARHTRDGGSDRCESL
jgi:hypothetical protein